MEDMMTTLRLGLLTAILSIAPVSVAVGQTMGQPMKIQPQAPMGMGTGMGQVPPPANLPKARELTEGQVQSYLTSMKELRALGQKAGALSKINPSQAESFGTGVQLSSEAQAVLTKNGFSDPAEFQSVAFNAAMAYGVLKEGGKEAVKRKLDQADAQQTEVLAKMRQHLKPEQAAAMEAQLKQSSKMAASMRDVPDANLALMTKYRSQMEEMSK
jgi:hypothetical protein